MTHSDIVWEEPPATWSEPVYLENEEITSSTSGDIHPSSSDAGSEVAIFHASSNSVRDMNSLDEEELRFSCFTTSA